MKFFLVSNEKIQFSESVVHKESGRYVRDTTFVTCWRPVEEDDQSLGEQVRGKFIDIVSKKRLYLEVGCHSSDKCQNNAAKISSLDAYLKQLCTTAHLKELQVEAKLTIYNLGFTYPKRKVDYRTAKLFTARKQIINPPEYGQFTLLWEELSFSNIGGMNFWQTDGYVFDGTLEIIIILSPIKSYNIRDYDDSVLKLKRITEMNRTILTDRIASDMSIITATGKAVLCHRAFLFAHTPVLQRLMKVKGTFENSKSNFIHMPELSEVSAQALLEYIYWDDTTKAAENCTVALELYTAAQKYGITGLQDSMRKLLLSYPKDWLQADMLLKLHSLLKNADGEEELKLKYAELIKL